MKNNSGQSLIEILIGLSIGALLIGAASMAIAFVLRSGSTVQILGTATELSQDLMNKTKSYAMANWTNFYSLSHTSSTKYFLISSSTGFVPVQGMEGVIDNEIKNGLGGRWGFDESTGSIAYDTSGNGDNGNIIGAARASSTCKISSCLVFTTNSTYVSIPTNPYVHPTSSISVAAWVNMATSTGTFDAVVIPSSDDYYLQAQWPKWRFYVYNQSGVYKDVFSINPITLNQWYFLVGTYDGTNVALYVNGVLQGVNPQSGSIRNSNGNLLISGTGRYFNGQIDDVRIYDRALSASEVKQIYSSNIFRRYFYVDDICRSVSPTSTSPLSGNPPCGGGYFDDPSTQEISAVTEWDSAGKTTNFTLSDYVTRWSNFTFNQKDWSGGSGQTGPFSSPSNQFSSSSNITTNPPGSIQIQNLTQQ
ncbi:LamG domain-containing protein [Patescibacteria group bacterium]|nr:LamG domain-containing protein [Patescibacteria group bacterium]